MNCILKFRYFFIFFLIVSCGSKETKKNKELEQKANDVETSANGNTTSKTILFFGDSLTAGYGLDDTNNAFPALIQEMLDSLELDYTVINSGLSGETTAGGRSRLNWVLNQKIDIFVLELGANDGLRGIPLKETKENLQAIIDAVRKKYPDAIVVLAGMQIPPNMGQDYTAEFRTLFPELAEKNKLPLIPFLLKDVGGISELNQEDGIHPTEEGQKIVAENVWEVLKEVIEI